MSEERRETRHLVRTRLGHLEILEDLRGVHLPGRKEPVTPEEFRINMKGWGWVDLTYNNPKETKS